MGSQDRGVAKRRARHPRGRQPQGRRRGVSGRRRSRCGVRKLPSRILVPRRQGNGNEGETGSGDVRKAAGEADNTGRPAKEVGLLPSVSLVLTSSSETVQMRQSVSSATMIRTI